MPRVDPLRNRTAWMIVALVLGAAACRTDARDAETPVSDSAAEGRVTIGDIEWYVDYDAALAVAREQDKALWVHFGEDPG